MLPSPAVSCSSGRPAGRTPRLTVDRPLVTCRGYGPYPPTPSTLVAAFSGRVGWKQQ